MTPSLLEPSEPDTRQPDRRQRLDEEGRPVQVPWLPADLMDLAYSVEWQVADDSPAA
jgi:hypothetical protein